MTELQRLFDNGYHTRNPHPSSENGGATTTFRVLQRSRLRLLRPTLLAVGVGLLLGVPALASALPAHPHVAPTIQPWSRYDTGRVNVVFPSQLPVVQLVQDANQSVSATLQLTAIYELSPGGLPTPTVVAAAFPDLASAFNSSSVPSTSSGHPVGLTAQLSVFPVGLALWSSPDAPAATGAPIGATTLTVSYSATTNTATDAGVALNWTLSAWPWVLTGDLLALEFSFSNPSGTSLTACTGSTLLFLTSPPCAGAPIAVGTPLWGTGYTSLEGESGAGPVALVSWGNSVDFGTSTSPIRCGADAVGGGVGELVLSAPGFPGSGASGKMAFALVAPPSSTVSALLHANPLLFAAALAVLGAVAAAGVTWYRRHDRRVRESL
jgi:hypothetical protein